MWWTRHTASEASANQVPTNRVSSSICTCTLHKTLRKEQARCSVQLDISTQTVLGNITRRCISTGSSARPRLHGSDDERLGSMDYRGWGDPTNRTHRASCSAKHQSHADLACASLERKTFVPAATTQTIPQSKDGIERHHAAQDCNIVALPGWRTPSACSSGCRVPRARRRSSCLLAKPGCSKRLAMSMMILTPPAKRRGEHMSKNGNRANRHEENSTNDNNIGRRARTSTSRWWRIVSCAHHLFLNITIPCVGSQCSMFSAELANRLKEDIRGDAAHFLPIPESIRSSLLILPDLHLVGARQDGLRRPLGQLGRVVLQLGRQDRSSLNYTNKGETIMSHVRSSTAVRARCCQRRVAYVTQREQQKHPLTISVCHFISPENGVMDHSHPTRKQKTTPADTNTHTSILSVIHIPLVKSNIVTSEGRFLFKYGKTHVSRNVVHSKRNNVNT